VYTVQPHLWKALAETFRMICLNISLSLKIAKIRSTPVLGSHPKQVKHSPKRAISFISFFTFCCVLVRTFIA